MRTDRVARIARDMRVRSGRKFAIPKVTKSGIGEEWFIVKATRPYYVERCEPPRDAMERGSSAHDPVDHPKHYTSHPSGVECIAVTRHMSFNVGNAMKYLWRAGLKDSSPLLEDLKKARWYLDDEIKRLEERS